MAMPAVHVDRAEARHALGGTASHHALEGPRLWGERRAAVPARPNVAALAAGAAGPLPPRLTGPPSKTTTPSTGPWPSEVPEHGVPQAPRLLCRRAPGVGVWLGARHGVGAGERSAVGGWSPAPAGPHLRTGDPLGGHLLEHEQPGSVHHALAAVQREERRGVCPRLCARHVRFVWWRGEGGWQASVLTWGLGAGFRGAAGRRAGSAHAGEEPPVPSARHEVGGACHRDPGSD